MGESRFTLTAYIAPPSSDESDYGHMWISLDDNQKGLKEHYGFHPEEEGRPYSPVGSVRTDDGLKYTIIQSQKSFPITEETYHDLRSYCQKTLTGTFGPYMAAGNSCVNYAWDIMNAAGIGDKGLNNYGYVIHNYGGEIWPAYNERFLNSVYNYYMAKWNNENPKTFYATVKEKFVSPW